MNQSFFAVKWVVLLSLVSFTVSAEIKHAAEDVGRGAGKKLVDQVAEALQKFEGVAKDRRDVNVTGEIAALKAILQDLELQSAGKKVPSSLLNWFDETRELGREDRKGLRNVVQLLTMYADELATLYSGGQTAEEKASIAADLASHAARVKELKEFGFDEPSERDRVTVLASIRTMRRLRNSPELLRTMEALADRKTASDDTKLIHNYRDKLAGFTDAEWEDHARTGKFEAQEFSDYFRKAASLGQLAAEELLNAVRKQTDWNKSQAAARK